MQKTELYHHLILFFKITDRYTLEQQSWTLPLFKNFQKEDGTSRDGSSLCRGDCASRIKAGQSILDAKSKALPIAELSNQ